MDREDESTIGECIKSEYTEETIYYKELSQGISGDFVHAKKCCDLQKRDIALCCHLLQILQNTITGNTTIKVDDIIDTISISNKNSTYQYAVAEIENTTFVAFTGTKTLNHALTDIKIVKTTPWHNYSGKVHSGFYEQSKNIQLDSIASTINMTNKKSLVMCGYSLGGAIAQMVGIRIMRDKIHLQEKIRIYTIGSPLIGNEKFSEHCSDFVNNIFHVIHYDDVVPKLLLKYGYKGFGKYIVLKDNSVQECNFKDIEADTEYTNKRSIQYGIQKHMINHYVYFVTKLYKVFLEIPAINDRTKVNTWGIPILNTISKITMLSSKIRIEIKGQYLDHISRLTFDILDVLYIEKKTHTSICVVCKRAKNPMLKIDCLRTSYSQIFGETTEKIVQIMSKSEVIDGELCTKQREIMSKENIQTVIQRAIFGAEYDILNENKVKYKSYLIELENITKNTNISSEAHNVMKVPTALSTDLDMLQIIQDKYKMYEAIPIEELKNLASKSESTTDSQVMNFIIYLKSKENFVTDTKLNNVGTVKQQRFSDALGRNIDTTHNIVEIYVKTADSRVRIMEYLSKTDITKFLTNNWQIALDRAVVFAGGAAIFIGCSAFLCLPIVVGGLWLGSVAATGAGTTILAIGGVSVFLLLGITANILEYLRNVEKGYLKNLELLSKAVGIKDKSDDIWSLERNIYNSLMHNGIKKYENFLTTESAKYIAKGLVKDACKSDFIGYMKAVYLVHELRRMAMGSFTIAVIGPTKVGKSKLLSCLGFPSKPSGTENTKVISSYSKLNDSFKFIDFPGFDDIDDRVRLQFETNNQLANMYIIVLDAMRLNTISQHQFIINFILDKNDIPIIILCNKSDELIKPKEDENPSSVATFDEKIKPFKDTVFERRKDNIDIYACCMIKADMGLEIKLKEYNILTHTEVVEKILNKINSCGIVVDKKIYLQTSMRVQS